MNQIENSKVSRKRVSLEDMVYGIKEELSDQFDCVKENSKTFIDNYQKSLSDYLFIMYLFPTSKRKLVHNALPDINFGLENLGKLFGNITGATALSLSSLYFIDQYGPKGILLTPIATNLASKAYELGREFAIGSYNQAKNHTSK